MYGADRQDRWKGAGGAALLVAVIGYGLVAGLDVRLTQRIAEQLTVVDLLPEAPPPTPDPVPAPKQAQKREEGAASPPNLRSRATPIVAPVPMLVLRPSPVMVAPVAGVGAEASQGAAPVAGPGSGSGGVGNGTGSGSGGDGDGGGGGEIPLRLIHGELRYKDLPRDLFAANVGGTVGMRFNVDAKGRVTACTVTRSSGNAELDAATCRLIVTKLRYRPTINAAGRAVPDTVEGEQVWDVRPEAPDGERDDPR